MSLPDSPQPISVSDLDPHNPVPNGYRLLDVREQNEWDAGHVPGSVHIPMSELPERVGELPEEELIVACRSGGRSERVSAWLNSTGYNAYNLNGGLGAWHQAGLPLSTEDGGQGGVL